MSSCPNATTSSAGDSSRTSASTTPQGKLVFDGRFVDDNLSYRAYRFQWIGTPGDAPRGGRHHRQGAKMTVYVSWNGATSVDSWRVFGGSSATALKPVVTARKSGFETAITRCARLRRGPGARVQGSSAG